LLRIGLAVLVLVVIFGFVLPRTANYGDAWDTIAAMTPLEVGVIAIAGLWNLFTYWPMMILALPGLRLREAAVVNQASTAVANTVPAGGAIALGVTYEMLRSWGFTSPSIASQVLATGIWNALVKFGLPVIALVAVAATGELEGSFVKLALFGLGALGVALVVSVVVLRAEASTRRVGGLLDRLFAVSIGRFWRRATDIEGWLVRMRGQMIDLIHTTGYRITAAAVISHLSLYAVLLITLRSVGVSEAEASWAKVLAGFALVRLLSAIPITPGGVGVVELGYVGFLATGTAAGLDAQVAAAVLVFRAVTYVLPIVLGGVAWLVFRSARSWKQPPDTRGGIRDGVVALTL
jgi:uncharacterized protein (TIRG00374 family)